MIEQLFPELDKIKDPEARAKLRDAIKKAMAGNSEDIRELAKYKELPVPFRKFITSEDYLNYKDDAGNPILYPVVLDAMVDLNEGDYQEAVFTGGIGCGKMLNIDTPVPTPKGYTTMGALHTGDLIYGTDGKPYKVLAAHPISTPKKCYNLTFSTGEVISACSEHLWCTQDAVEIEREHSTGLKVTTVRTTEEISKDYMAGDKSLHRISLPTLGYCGNERNPMEKVGHQYTIGSLPSDILTWDYPSRLDVYKGLLDSSASESTSNRNILSIPKDEDTTLLVRLISSLGLHARYLPEYRDSVQEFIEVTTTDIFITQVETCVPTHMRCITVDSPDSLYLVGNTCIPTHNTTAALATIAYQLYKLSCLVNPQQHFGLDPSSEIVFIFQSVTERVAKQVNFARFKSLVDNSPYFKKYFKYNSDVESELQFPNRIYVKPVSAAGTATIGQNVYSGIIDEINFFAITDKSKKSSNGETYDQAVEVYNSMASRRKSRFLVNGKVEGLLCLVSSKNYPNDFTERKEREATTDKSIYIYSKRIWDIKPHDYTRGWFTIFVGDLSRPPRIIEDGFLVPEGEDHLYDQIPIDFKEDFERDMMRHLRETAGIATMALHPFIMDSTKIFNACTHQSIASKTKVDFVDSQIELDTMNLLNPTAKRWIHMDLALTGDSAGFVMGHIAKFVKVDRGDTFEIQPMFVVDMTLEVAPPLGGEIQFWKIRELIYALRDQLGIPVEWVSLDTYQSADTIQILRTKGFKAGVQSIDRTTAPYDVVKQALYDGRILMPPHERLCTELVQLEMDMKKGKVDHPPRGSCLPDTKITDTAGVVRTILEMVEGHSRGERYTVLGYNLEDKTFYPQHIIDPRMTRHTDTTYRLHDNEGVVVELTGEHKVLTLRGWVEAWNLVEGDEVISLATPKTITHIEVITHPKAIPVYDLGAYPDENFCLANGAVIHNSKDVADSLSGVLYGLITRGDIWLEAGIDPYSIPESVQALSASKSIEP